MNSNQQSKHLSYNMTPAVRKKYCEYCDKPPGRQTEDISKSDMFNAFIIQNVENELDPLEVGIGPIFHNN